MKPQAPPTKPVAEDMAEESSAEDEGEEEVDGLEEEEELPTDKAATTKRFGIFPL